MFDEKKSMERYWCKYENMATLSRLWLCDVMDNDRVTGMDSTNWPQSAWPFDWYCRLYFYLQCRRTTVSLPCAGMRTCLYTAVQLAAAPPQPRRPAGTSQEPAVPVCHLRQRLRYRILSTHPHGQGKKLIDHFTLARFMSWLIWPLFF